MTRFQTRAKHGAVMAGAPRTQPRGTGQTEHLGWHRSLQGSEVGTHVRGGRPALLRWNRCNVVQIEI